MATTKKAVRVMWHDANGSSGDVTVGFIAPSTADAVCMMLDHLEVAGVRLEDVECFSIVAKSGIGAELLLSDGAAREEFLRTHRQAREVATCAA